MTLTYGSLFAGYDGIGLGLQEVWPDARIKWYSDVCRFGKDGTVGHHDPHRGACAIMAHHHPDVPNLGDVSAVDWSQVEPVDILTGGSPCQDLSHAGKRAGMTEGTRSNLWVAMREAIAQLRPGLVVWENVRGAYSAEADSDVEQCEGCLGDRSGQPVLRALGRVLGDLSDLGYVGGWHGLRAADVGAPHGRFRVFVVAYPASNEGRVGNRDGEDAAVPEGVGLQAREQSIGNAAQRSVSGGNLLPTPRATDGTNGGPNQRGSSGDLMLPSAVAHLLPTPTTAEIDPRESVEDWQDKTRRLAERGSPAATLNLSEAVMFGRTKADLTAEALLPTPSVALADGGQTSRSGDRKGELLLGGIVADESAWGAYAPAIARWEHVLGRTAPAPTQTSSKGNPQLSPAFVEWMLGLPAGHVTDVPGLSRNDMLKALGNGVVPAQCAEAVRFLLEVLSVGRNEDM